MHSVLIVMSILYIHWVADFVMQSDEDAKGKSTCMGHLLSHTSQYTACWLLWLTPLAIYFGIPLINVVYFCTVTFVLHTVTDYYTSRLNSYLWKKNDTHHFFVSIGFDQLLHYLQLFISYKLFIG